MNNDNDDDDDDDDDDEGLLLPNYVMINTLQHLIEWLTRHGKAYAYSMAKLRL